MKTSSFGQIDIPAKEKPARVRRLFDGVAANYDLMNDLMSFGVHRLWKDALIEELQPVRGKELVDVAGGTGDIAARFLRAGGGRATLVDPTFAMMQQGRAKQANKKITWLGASAEYLPLPDNSFDVYTISFGLRNVTDIAQSLREAYRVLRPGGKFFCLEFSAPVFAPLSRAYDLYSDRVLPFLGEIVAKDRAAYQYLIESIRRFPKQEALEALMRETGFECVRHRNLSGGICAIHQGLKA